MPSCLTTEALRFITPVTVYMHNVQQRASVRARQDFSGLAHHAEHKQPMAQVLFQHRGDVLGETFAVSDTLFSAFWRGFMHQFVSFLHGFMIEMSLFM